MTANSRGITEPLRAGFLTRCVYSLALLAFIPSAISGGSGWIALVLGGGAVAGVGRTGFLIIVALVFFRIYQVLRYPTALDARPPNIFCKFLRYTGWFAMFAGAAAGAGLFLVKPITLALFKTAGDAGIGYFVVGLWLVLLANLGWLGCVFFELSRASGSPLTIEVASKPWSKRLQDFVVLGVFLTTTFSAPFLLRQAAGMPCGEANLARCVSTTEGDVRRMIGLSHGEPIVLESMIEEIEMRSGSGERTFILRESPVISLKIAGYPVTSSPNANIRVRLEASQISEEVVLTMMVHEGSEETARFITHFGKDASIEKTSVGGVRVVVNLPSNAKPGMRSTYEDPASRKRYVLDQIFIQLRSAIGTEIEAREWSTRVVRPAMFISADETHRPLAEERFLQGPIDPACKGKVEGGPGQAIAFEGEVGWPLRGATFTGSTNPGPHAVLSSRDRLVCREDEIWIVSYPVRRPELRVRRYTSDGRILSFVDTTVPPAKLGEHEYDLVDPDSVREEGGRIRFERVVVGRSGAKRQEKKRELFEFTP